MHEMSLTRDVVSICEQNAAGRKVLSVTLEIGELSGIMPAAVQFCFDDCARGTAVEGALLRVEQTGARGRCRDCAAEFALQGFHGVCPFCGSDRMEIIAGLEMRVKDMEVE